ncbi:hypothetical protein HL658_12915 [Azospirillum sp. RWY-5-1]|uniref:Uncharacterized protein n=1 Tax=Azospirillum oleiclasticum TaxID=2735135 RepID=A0ABX2TD19_9PROT|nr:hypothetical protein [Azospirillum oleiclasticum]NYZ13454.1 hypothetical protein [Azospirillum oleiclasticum]NYZ20615.1 hypothetical protein [Azospirillum oleiclasticum]
MQRSFIVAITLALVALSAPVRADSIASNFPIGASFEGTVRVARTQIPLPLGKWEVTALNEEKNNNGDTIATLTLANFVAGRFFGFISIRTNVDVARGGWVLSAFCDRKDIYYILKDANYQHEQACWGINHFVNNPTSTYKPLYGKNIRMVLADKGMDMPRVTIVTTLNLAKSSSFIFYEIVLNPEYFGFSADNEGNWESSTWHKDLIHKDPRKHQFLDQIRSRYEPLYAQLKQQYR